MIQINDKIRIVKADRLNLQVEVLTKVKSKKTGEIQQEWKGYGYYGNLKSALIGVLKHCTNELCEEELYIKQVINKLNKVEELIKNALIKE